MTSKTRPLSAKRDKIIRHGVNQSLHEFGDDLRWEILGRTRQACIRGLEQAVKGEGPFVAPQHWALRMVLEMAQVVGAPIEVNALILAQLGAPAERAREALEVVQQAEALDVHDIAERALDTLLEYRREYPERYQALMRRLE